MNTKPNFINVDSKEGYIEQGNFTWKLLTPKQARAIFDTGAITLYKVYDDEDTESEVADLEDLEWAIDKDINIGLEVGFIDPCLQMSRCSTLISDLLERKLYASKLEQDKGGAKRRYVEFNGDALTVRMSDDSVVSIAEDATNVFGEVVNRLFGLDPFDSMLLAHAVSNIYIPSCNHGK